MSEPLHQLDYLDCELKVPGYSTTSTQYNLEARIGWFIVDLGSSADLPAPVQVLLHVNQSSLLASTCDKVWTPLHAVTNKAASGGSRVESPLYVRNSLQHGRNSGHSQLH